MCIATLWLYDVFNCLRSSIFDYKDSSAKEASLIRDEVESISTSVKSEFLRAIFLILTALGEVSYWYEFNFYCSWDECLGVNAFLGVLCFTNSTFLLLLLSLFVKNPASIPSIEC